MLFFCMCRNQNLWMLKISMIWHVHNYKSSDFLEFKKMACAEHTSLEFNEFKNLACAETKIFGMCKNFNLLIFIDFKDLACANFQIF